NRILRLPVARTPSLARGQEHRTLRQHSSSRIRFAERGNATPIKPRRVAAASKTSPAPAVITKIDRMKTRQGDSLFLKVDVNGETVRVFGRPEELAERLEASGYDIPASEIEAGMELHLPCLVKLGQGN